MPDVNLIIYNNDGAFQRMVCGNYDCTKAMILDGVLSGNEHGGILSILKTKLVRLLYFFVNKKLNFYLPSILGISNPDKIFVVTNYCKSYLQKNCVDKTKIHVTGFSRSQLKNQDITSKASKDVSKIVLLLKPLNGMASIILMMQ